MKDLLNSWGPTLATFVPIVGLLVLLAVPKAEESLAKIIALVTTSAVLVAPSASKSPTTTMRERRAR